MVPINKTRRDILRGVCGSLAAGPFLPRADSLRTRSPVMFLIAGVRFIEQCPVEFPTATKLRLMLESYGQDPCYAVYAGGSEKIGYVPRRLTEAFLPNQHLTAFIERSNRHALPWKRHLVRVPMGIFLA